MDEAAARREIFRLGLNRPMPWRSGLHLFTSWSGYAALAVLTVHVDTWAVRVPAWFLMAWLVVGNGAILHEGVHGHLFPWRWLNRAVATTAGLAVGFPYGVYRPYHLGHHQYSCTADDPEGIPYRFTSRLFYFAVPLVGPLFALQFLWWAARAAVGRPPRWVRSSRQRMAMVVDGTLTAAFYAAMVWLGTVSFEVLACVWLVPWLAAVMFLEPLVLVPEHYGAVAADADSALRSTRTVWSNRLVSWVFWGNNLHTAHHLHAGTVPQHFRRVAEEFVAPEIEPEWVSSGYLAFHRRVWAALPWLPARR